MATDARTAAPTNSSDALFRLWATAIRDAILAVGLVQTSDTGQMNFSTVTVPGTSTDAGYAMFAFADALQATKPVFIKLSFGTAANATQPRLIVSVGTATDGAGTLSGSVSALRTIVGQGTVAGDSTVRTIRTSGTTSRLVLAAFTGAGNTGLRGIFGVERSKDSSGSDEAAGVTNFWYLTGSSTEGITSVRYDGGALNEQSILPIIMWPAGTATSGTTAGFGADVGVFPMFGIKGGLTNPLKDVLGYYDGDIPVDTPVSITHYGASVTYWPLGSTAYNTSGRVLLGASAGALLMRWE